MKKAIAFFDFDGTLTTDDTLLEFIRFTKGNLGFLLGFGLNSPFLIGQICRIVPRQKAKERILGFYFRNMPVEIFDAQCARFARERLPRLLRPGAEEELRRRKEEGAVVIVSASPENWIKPWASGLGIEVIGSVLEVKNGRLTGRLEGRNCRDAEKVRRIRERYNLDEYTSICAYGDSSGDKEMLELANNAFYKPFREAGG